MVKKPPANAGLCDLFFFFFYSHEKLQDRTMDKIRALPGRLAMSWTPMVLDGSVNICRSPREKPE